MRRCRPDILILMLVMLPILASCRQELCYDHYPAIDIRFDWELEWERDYGQHHLDGWDAAYYGCEYDGMRPQIPEWINMIRYFDDGAPGERFLSPDGAKLQVEADRDCSILFYNGDTEYIVLSDVASYNEARATATSRSRTRSSLEALFEKHQAARTTNPPDVIYASFLDKVPGVKNHEHRPMPIKMQPLVYTYHITYEFEHGIEHVVQARGAIGGMAEGVYLRTGITTEESSIILFDCDVRQHGVQAQVRSFGAPAFPDIYYGRTEGETNDRLYTLNLELLLKNGKTLEFNYDVSDQLKTQPRGGVIKITGVRVEDEEVIPPPGSGSAFDVEVDDWGEEDNIDIPIDKP